MAPKKLSGRGRSVLLLISSHGRFPTGADTWVRAAVAALNSLNPDKDLLVTSVGLPGWELTAYLAAQKGFSQKLILPGLNNAAGKRYYNRCLHNLALDCSLTEPVFTGTGESREFPSARDTLAFTLADLACPVSIRPGGRLDTLLGEYIARRGRTIEHYRVKYDKKIWLPRYNLAKDRLNPELLDFGDQWLIHWTHSHPGPWPDEQAAEYYRDMLNKPESYVRSAGATLERILAEGVVRGSSTHMAASEMTVSLSSLPLSEALAAMRWRSRWRRWNMEPYGIAVRRSALVPLGARQVQYYHKIPVQLTAAEKIFSQRRGKSTDWSAEQEWRIHGDLNLDDIDPDEITLLVYDRHWEETLPERAGLYKTVAISAENC